MELKMMYTNGTHHIVSPDEKQDPYMSGGPGDMQSYRISHESAGKSPGGETSHE